MLLRIHRIVNFLLLIRRTKKCVYVDPSIMFLQPVLKNRLNNDLYCYFDRVHLVAAIVDFTEGSMVRSPHQCST